MQQTERIETAEKKQLVRDRQAAFQRYWKSLQCGAHTTDQFRLEWVEAMSRVNTYEEQTGERQ